MVKYSGNTILYLFNKVAYKSPRRCHPYTITKVIPGRSRNYESAETTRAHHLQRAKGEFTKNRTQCMYVLLLLCVCVRARAIIKVKEVWLFLIYTKLWFPSTAPNFIRGLHATFYFLILGSSDVLYNILSVYNI